MRRQFLPTKKQLITAITIATVGFVLFGYHKTHAAFIQDCKPNSIIVCGTPNATDFISKVQAGGPKHDLQAVYARFGLEPGEYDQFVTNSVAGVAKQDGTIVVKGRVVATNAWSIGRTHFSYATPYTINGKTYYKAMTSRVLQQDLPVMVMFNSKGVMKFAVMNACGNPVAATLVRPKLSCDLLNKSEVSGMPNTFDFTTNASAANGAVVKRVTYDFGDGSTAESATSLTKTVRHTFSKPGTWTVRVTVTVNLPGGGTTTVTSANCQTTVTVAQPFFQCVSLEPFTVDKEKRQFRFIVTTHQGNGATLQNADFNFGDGETATAVGLTNETTVETEHTFATDGNFAVTATVHFNTVNGGVEDVSCATNVSLTPTATPPPPPPPPPQELTNTGPGTGSTIGLFAVTSTVAGLGYKYFVLKKTRS
ncbi:MAG TPA: PKD domain-containing protein [Candidatus Saccharimonadales bacterium]|nr:PKD domain-containing protein [Candidatus Saccharimonadales bacterium]